MIGGGSNLLLTTNVIEKTVVLIDLKGIEFREESDKHVRVKAMAGENWHDFVQNCVQHDYGGLENLSLIPGKVGAAPIQNIGAYGVELKDRFVSCSAIDRKTLEHKSFTREACEFGYRDSFFKKAGKDRYIITSVTFQLTRKEHELNTSYGAIENLLQERGIREPGIRHIAQAVIDIRKSKLPDPDQLGNSGSCFKNPHISQEKLRSLEEDFPDIPHYYINDTEVKVPAGWLIEKGGCKAFRQGDAGVYPKQALVLVNYGNASGEDLLLLARRIQDRVQEKFGISI